MKGLIFGPRGGLFFDSPLIMINRGKRQRPFQLALIDRGDAPIGCAIIAVILTLF